MKNLLFLCVLMSLFACENGAEFASSKNNVIISDPTENLAQEQSYREATESELRILEENGLWTNSGSRWTCSWSDGQYGGTNCSSWTQCVVVFGPGPAGQEVCLACKSVVNNETHYDNIDGCRPALNP